jgi:valyl-tRNA synthetase
MELSKNYTPQQTESKWYEHWIKQGYFHSAPDKNQEPFTIVIPPPNVTGVLHMGHTLNETVQDILIRRAKMSGYNTCWVPGSDHASIATEARVVNMLKEKGIDKHQLSRKEFLQYAFEWKEKYGGIIYQQIKKLGCSCDWDRTTFTMDDHYYQAVIKVFVALYNKGVIYRGARMINWDPAAQTALSDEEVEYREVQSKLYYINYQLVNDSGQPIIDEFITVATTRPETILGDVAVCVNPEDKRYQHLVGQYVFVPLINRKIPIIADGYVDKDFGTGCLKITPAHDINDYNIGLKYNLPVIDVLNPDGTMSEAAQLYTGEDRFVVRKKIVEELHSKRFLSKEENILNKNGFSQRTNAVVEPRISTQWFVKMKKLAEPALEAVISGKVKIHPEERFLNTYKYWMENVKDWCISRQLWWGQRIPAWYCVGDDQCKIECKEPIVSEIKPEACPHCGSKNLRQDEDVLDTWFSSWLWPIEVFNGVTNPGNPDINYYYPTSVLVTGQDIIFFWVARMIMAGLEFKNKIPFHDVYFTGMVRDKQGRKMSKSLGNSPDLLELIDRFGADAVRFGIMISSPAGNDLLFDESSCEQGRNFCNKIWNALKLLKLWEVKLASRSQQSAVNSEQANNFAVQWFENRLNEASREIEKCFKEYRLSEALKIIYSLIWDDFCSWYLEWIKPAPEEKIEVSVYESSILFFEKLLQLLHPFMPFVTEEIYHQLKEREIGNDLIIKKYEPLLKTDEIALAKGELALEIIIRIRDNRNVFQIKQKEPIILKIQTKRESLYKEFIHIIIKQNNIAEVIFSENEMTGDILFIIHGDTFYIETNKEIDTKEQKKNLLKDLYYLKGFLESVEKKLNNERFMQHAKPEIVETEKRKKRDAEEKIRTIEESLKAL